MDLKSKTSEDQDAIAFIGRGLESSGVCELGIDPLQCFKWQNLKKQNCFRSTQ